MEREKLIARIAYLYYFENMDLKKIGSLFGLSYSTISRFLKKGKEEGIIRITINSSYNKEIGLEEELRKELNLKKVISVYVEEQYSYNNILNLLGTEAADYFSSILKDGDNLGISLGETIYNVVESIRNIKQKNINLIQLFGHTPWFPIEFTSLDFINKLQNKFKWSYNFINSELLVDDKKTKRILMNSQSMKKVFKLHDKIDIALLSVGSLSPKLPYYYHEDYFRRSEIKELIDKKIIGETVFCYFDLNGNIFETELNKRMICISVKNLKAIKNKILVSGGSFKSKAILGAARAGLVDTLITDSVNVKKLLELSKV